MHCCIPSLVVQLWGWWRWWTARATGWRHACNREMLLEEMRKLLGIPDGHWQQYHSCVVTSSEHQVIACRWKFSSYGGGGGHTNELSKLFLYFQRQRHGKPQPFNSSRGPWRHRVSVGHMLVLTLCGYGTSKWHPHCPQHLVTLCWCRTSKCQWHPPCPLHLRIKHWWHVQRFDSVRDPESGHTSYR